MENPRPPTPSHPTSKRIRRKTAIYMKDTRSKVKKNSHVKNEENKKNHYTPLKVENNFH